MYLRPFLVLLALCAVSCSKQDSLRDFERYKKLVCSCENDDCVEDVEKEFKDLDRQLEELSAADKEKAALLGVEALECIVAKAGETLDEEMQAADAEIEKHMQEFRDLQAEIEGQTQAADKEMRESLRN